MKRALNSSVQISAVPFGINLFRLGGAGRRYSMPLIADPLGVGMDPQPTFALIAELSLALAGFGGVAAAFGGRDRSYAPVEMTRLRVLFTHAFLALSTSLFAIGLLFATTTETACRWASIAGVLSQTPTSAYFLRRIHSHTANQETTPGWWGFVYSFAALVAIPLLFGASIFWEGGSVLLVFALSTQLLYGLWIFMRLLIHRN
jgi:hypothetical protein